MNILKKLFGGKTPEIPRGKSGQISYYKVLVQSNIEVNTHRCDICGTTFALPTGFASVYSMDIENFHLDVGGVCVNALCSQAFSTICSRHVKFVSDGQEFPNWQPGCQFCGDALAPGSEKVMEIVKSYKSLVKQLRRR